MVVFSLICGAYGTKEKKRKWVVFGKAWEQHTPTEERLGPWMSGHPCETPWETFCGTRGTWETLQTFAGCVCWWERDSRCCRFGGGRRRKRPYGDRCQPVIVCSGGGGVKICGGELKSVSLSSKRSTVTLGEGLTM